MSSTTRIVHISDVHIGDAAPELLADATHAINEAKPDLIVLSGDLTQAGRKREYEGAAAFLLTLPGPIVAAPGNHDAPVYNVLARVAAPYARFRRLPVQSTWREQDNIAAAAAISTARALQARLDWSQGVYPLSALRAALTWSSGAAWRVLAAHHPPMTYDGARVRSDARRGRAALEILAATPRTLLLCGHSHGFRLETLGDEASAVIVAPSLSSGRPRDGGHGFVQIDLTADAAEIALALRNPQGRYDLAPPTRLS